MVERLKSAIDKARAQRVGVSGGGAEAFRAPSNGPAAVAVQAAAPAHDPVEESLRDWTRFPELELDERLIESERIVARSKKDAAHRAFDMLRTRTMRVMHEKKWRRLAITSPTKGVGKTVVSVNLAFSLARQKSTRVLLLDLDLAAPRVGSVLCPERKMDMRSFLMGATPPEDFFLRCSDNMIVGLNGESAIDASEILQSASTKQVLDDAIEKLQPDIVIYDLSPVMVTDDALNVLSTVDCAMMVVAAGETVASEVRESEKLITEWTELLGVVLNKSSEKNRDLYGY